MLQPILPLELVRGQPVGHQASSEDEAVQGELLDAESVAFILVNKEGVALYLNTLGSTKQIEMPGLNLAILQLGGDVAGSNRCSSFSFSLMASEPPETLCLQITSPVRGLLPRKVSHSNTLEDILERQCCLYHRKEKTV